MGVLKIEIENIENRMRLTQKRLDEINDDFWESGGTDNCCHDCFSAGEWDKLQTLQYVREDRIKQLQYKIETHKTKEQNV